MFSISGKVYAPALRWKMGEMEALRTLDEATSNRLLPHIIVPPIKATDLEKGRPLTSKEFNLLQIGRLQQNWASRVCLLDLRFVSLSDDKGSDAAYVSELLTQAARFGCKAIPVVDASTDDYRFGAVAPYIVRTNSGLAIRLALCDLQDGIEELLTQVQAAAHVDASECLLILDLGDATISEVGAFSKFVAEWLSKLHQLGRWSRIIVQASNYPLKNPAPINGDASPERLEWHTWRKLVEDDPSMLEWALFGDFGADHGQFDFKPGGRPLSHIRYATADSWLVCRGGDTTETVDGSIHAVATRIVRSGKFLGEAFSYGDEFIAMCAAREAFGNPSTWRTANMSHHLTLAAVSAASLAGSPFAVRRASRERQLSLLDN
jgi:hypothetical protein